MDAGFEIRTVTIKEAVSTNMQYKSKDSFDLLMIARDTSILQLLIGNKPEPSKQFVHFLLNEGASLNPGPWELHSIEVAESAEKIAKEVLKNVWVKICIQYFNEKKVISHQGRSI